MSINDALVGKYCVGRFYSAGVHAGVVLAIEKNNGTWDVLLGESRRLWTWDADGVALSGVAQKGLKKGCKVDTVNPIIGVSQGIELIPCSTQAEQSIRDYP